MRCHEPRRLIEQMCRTALLTEGEARSAIIAQRMNDRRFGGAEAVVHFGGSQVVIEQAIRTRQEPAWRRARRGLALLLHRGGGYAVMEMIRDRANGAILIDDPSACVLCVAMQRSNFSAAIVVLMNRMHSPVGASSNDPLLQMEALGFDAYSADAAWATDEHCDREFGHLAEAWERLLNVPVRTSDRVVYP